jgi:hypothetical protein
MWWVPDAALAAAGLLAAEGFAPEVVRAPTRKADYRGRAVYFKATLT